MFKRISLISVLVLSLVGCGKKADETATASPASRPNPPKPPPVATEAGKEAEPPPPDSPHAVVSMAVPNRPAEAAEDDFKNDPKDMTRADALTQCVKRFIVAYGRPPKPLEEMVEKGIVPRLPPAPQGKKYAYDEMTKRVVVVNQ